jgi:uncharacterized protein
MGRSSPSVKPGSLLDANALIALCWSAHEHHAAALKWFKAESAHGWATCAFTQAAFVRVVLQPAFSGEALRASEVIDVLTQTTSHPKHRYLVVDFEMDWVSQTCTGGLMGHRQITDAWLLATAVRHGLRLVTFDRGVPNLLASETERTQHIELLA